MKRAPMIAVASMLALAPFVTMTTAQATEKGGGATLFGSWSGGGTVVLANGRRERATCRARFSPSGPRVSFVARCATRSGNVDQAAKLRRVGPNTYAGNFFNPGNNLSGSIHIKVHGNRQSVSVRSGRGSASLTLRHG